MPSSSAVERETTRVRELAECGETELATILAIRALASAQGHARAALLNDLSVLRYAEGDRRGALALARAALDLDAQHALARENLDALQALGAAGEDSVDAALATGAAALNPWVSSALESAERVAGLKGKRVLEVGGSVPRAAVRELGVEHWTACDLRPAQPDAEGYTTLTADAADLPLEDGCMDVAWSV